MRYCYFSADHIKPDQARINMNELKRARKPGHEYTPEYMPSGNEYEWDDIGVPPVAAKSAKEIVSGIGIYSDEDVDLIDDPFTYPELLGTEIGKKKNVQRNSTKGMAKKNEPELSPESDSDDSGSIHTESEDSIDETDLSEDSDDSDEEDSSNVDEVDSDEEDSDDTGEEEEDDDDDDSDSDDESDDDSDDSDGDSDDEPDTDDDDEEEDDEDDDDENSDDNESDDDDDEDDEADDDSDDIDDEKDSDDDDTDDDDSDYDDSDEEDDDEEDDDDEDGIDDADEEEDEPVKVPYGPLRKGKGKVTNSSNFSTRGHKGGFDETQYAEKLTVSQAATMVSDSNHWRLPFISTTLFGEATNNKSELSLKKRFSSMTLRDLLNPVITSSSEPSGVMELDTQRPTSFFSWLKSPRNLRRVEKIEQMRLFQ